ncbi:hypothetical protein JCM11641_001636 [Rhodosporidiobolus odoratus]
MSTDPNAAVSPRIDGASPTPAGLPSFNSPSSSRLSAALDLQAQLRQRLQDAKVELQTRRNLVLLQQARERDAREGRRETSEQRQAHAAGILKQVTATGEQVELVKDQRATRERVVEAMDRSHLVSTHLFAQSGAGAEDSSERRATLQAILARRDSLALELLQLQNSLRSLNTERLALRKKLLALTRQNANSTAELRTLRQPPEELIERLPHEVAEYYQNLQDETLTTLSRLSIVRNVFQRLVVESGVPFPVPSSDSTPSALLAASNAAADGDPDASLTDERLLSLLLACGDSALTEDDALAPEGMEEGQKLPKELRGVMEKWRREEQGRRKEEKGKRVRRTRTV